MQTASDDSVKMYIGVGCSIPENKDEREPNILAVKLQIPRAVTQKRVGKILVVATNTTPKQILTPKFASMYMIMNDVLSWCSSPYDRIATPAINATEKPNKNVP